MAPDVAPDWPNGHVDGTYRMEIDGDPVIRCDMVLGELGGANDAAMCATRCKPERHPLRRSGCSWAAHFTGSAADAPHNPLVP